MLRPIHERATATQFHRLHVMSWICYQLFMPTATEQRYDAGVLLYLLPHMVQMSSNIVNRTQCRYYALCSTCSFYIVSNHSKLFYIYLQDQRLHAAQSGECQLPGYLMIATGLCIHNSSAYCRSRRLWLYHMAHICSASAIYDRAVNVNSSNIAMAQ